MSQNEKLDPIQLIGLIILFLFVFKLIRTFDISKISDFKYMLDWIGDGFLIFVIYKMISLWNKASKKK